MNRESRFRPPARAGRRAVAALALTATLAALGALAPGRARGTVLEPPLHTYFPFTHNRSLASVSFQLPGPTLDWGMTDRLPISDADDSGEGAGHEARPNRDVFRRVSGFSGHDDDDDDSDEEHDEDDGDREDDDRDDDDDRDRDDDDDDRDEDDDDRDDDDDDDDRDEDDDDRDDDDDDDRDDDDIEFSEPRRIDNPYLPLTKFTTCELRGEEGAAQVHVVRRLLDRTEPFSFDDDTVRTAVIEDRAFEDGELVERTLDYFAQADDGTVYYFGEDVDNYEDGQIVDHEGSWRYGRDTDTLGVAMPADPEVGDRWRFEDVPGITIESNTLVARLDRISIRGTTYEDVIRVREFLEIEGDIEHKLYARGIGLVRELPPDGRVDLVRCE